MKIKYSVREMLTFSGEIEMTKEEYDDLRKRDDDALGNIILDRIDRNDPSDWEIYAVDDFESVDD
ncbi:MAG: hypothetical protein WC332_00680 [Clostridia bacterium]|jgi:hypothetical protein